MRLRTIPQFLVGAVVLALGGLTLPTTASASLLHVTVAATQPPSGLGPGQTGISTITVTNSGKSTVSVTKVTVTLPAASSTTPTVTFSPGYGSTCAPKSTNPLVQVCKVTGLGPDGTVTVGTLTGTPPTNIGSGMSTSAKIAGPANTVTVTWQWGLPELVTAVSLSPSTIELGQYVSGTLTVTNVGNGTAGGFITDTPLPSKRVPRDADQ